MSYVVTIARYIDVESGQISPIAPVEWQKLVADDPSLASEGPLDSSGQSVRWTAHPKTKNFLFLYQPDGVVHLTGPDEHTLRKGIEIARRLGARVRGEEGEFLEDAFDGPASSSRGCSSTALLLLIVTALTCIAPHYAA